MIPYIEIYSWHLGPLPFRPFGILLVLSVTFAWFLAKYRAKKFGIELKTLASFVQWLMVGGFVGGHVFDLLFYHPADVARSPRLLLLIWDGQSSYGGFIGTVIGGLLWRYFELVPALKIGGKTLLERPVRRKTPHPVMLLGDIIASIFPFGWMIGRLGCSVVHDHPGARATTHSLLAVQYGFGPADDYGFFALHHGIEPRYDLGLLELMFTAVIAIGFALTWKKNLPTGSYMVALCVVYPPVRFILDFFRLDDDQGGDLRYFTLTPAQWACFGFFIVGLWLANYLRTHPRIVPAESAPASPAT